MDIQKRIERLRGLMAEDKIDIYLVPTADCHQSEYVGEHFKARQYLTGFTGSAGTLIVTAKEAGLWTDGRYFIQAAGELAGTPVTLRKMREPGVPSIEEYLEETLPEGGTLGFDGRVVSVKDGRKYEKIAEKKRGGIQYRKDLAGAVWENRPPMSKKEVFALALKYAGESRAEKLRRIREEMKKHGADLHVLTTLDDICWMLNIRGDDVECFPLALSYAVVAKDSVKLYIDSDKVSAELQGDLAKDGVILCPYNGIYEDVKNFDAGSVVLLDESAVNYTLYQNISKDTKKCSKQNPAVVFKAMKNETEISNIRKAQLKDSIAHVRFMKWLKEHIGKIRISEMSASDKLDAFREQMGNYLKPSFSPISAYGAHAAMAHYSATPETDAELEEGNFFLMDTGAGYMEGSTDITRTYALGELPKEMKEQFTVTAISNLNLANARFLKGACGLTLDYAARKPFWDRNLDYNHGTGHGVGYLLNIHEGPANFYWQYRERENAELQKGMVITDEPGFYVEGSHGIRLENELLVCEGEKNQYGQFLYFETITLIPFDLDAICADMLSAQERQLLNDYHRKVYEGLAACLTEEEREWLKAYTREI